MSERTEESPAEIARELCRGVLSGNPEAWERLVEQYGRLVLAIPRELGLGEDDCEEVFQTTWLALYRDLHRIERPGALPKWIATTARRHAWRALERRKRDGAVVPSGEEELRGGAVEGLLAAESRQLIHDSIEEMPGRCRDLLLLLFFDRRPLSYAAIAGELGVAEGSVGPGRVRCLAELARILERRGLGVD